MLISNDERIALLGSSRGLGWETYQELHQKNSNLNFLLVSRKIKNRSAEISKKTTLLEQDFSKTPVEDLFLNQLNDFSPTRMIYFAGGGPYGLFHEKKWNDHQWALNTNFLYPAQLIHTTLNHSEKWPNLKQITLIGSSVAESQPDPLAASYSAAKHALKGLMDTLQSEFEQRRIKTLLFSPGYMQTDLLPLHSKPRQLGLAENPRDVAKKLIAMLEKND